MTGFFRKPNDNDSDVLVAELVEYVTVKVEYSERVALVRSFEIGDERIQQIEDILNGKAGNAEDT